MRVKAIVGIGRLKIGLRAKVTTMDAMVIGAAFVGSMATAFVVQRAVLGAMLRAFERAKRQQ
jgi:hypothetical protein